MKIVVLGGAGKMGSVAVQDLVSNPKVDEVVVADRNAEAAQEIATYLGSSKLRVERVDLSDQATLARVLKGADACINSTAYATNLKVMEACLEARTHYTDLGGLFHITREQQKLHDRFAAAGISAVIGMGSAPGITNIAARFAADRLDTIDHIRIYDGIKPPASQDVLFTYAVGTIIDEITLAPTVFRDGAFVECQPLSELEEYSFTAPLGVLPMHLSLHSEVATLPVSFAAKGVKECFYKINYWGMPSGVVEKVKTLADFGFAGREAVTVDGAVVSPRSLMLELMGHYVPSVTANLEPPPPAPQWVEELVTEVKGTRVGQPVTYRVGVLTTKGALPTGVAPAQGAVWQAAGRVPPGVYAPELAFAPEPFLIGLKGRGIPTQVTVTSSL